MHVLSVRMAPHVVGEDRRLQEHREEEGRQADGGRRGHPAVLKAFGNFAKPPTPGAASGCCGNGSGQGIGGHEFPKSRSAIAILRAVDPQPAKEELKGHVEPAPDPVAHHAASVQMSMKAPSVLATPGVVSVICWNRSCV